MSPGPGHDDSTDATDALRAALYREGATEADRAAYEAAVARAQPGPERPDHQRPDGERPADERALAQRSRRRVVRPRRRAIVAGLAAAVVIAGGTAVVLATRPAPKPPYPTVASTPIALTGDAADQAVSRADLQALFLSPKPFLGLYLAQHPTALSASIRTDSIAVDGRGTGPTTVSLAGIASPGQETGLMTVLLACDRGAAYSWVLTGPRRSRTGASGGDCGGGIVTATFVPRPNRIPTRIRITVPAGVRLIVEVDLSKY